MGKSFTSSLAKQWVTGYSILFKSLLPLVLKIQTSKSTTSKKYYSSIELAVTCIERTGLYTELRTHCIPGDLIPQQKNNKTHVLQSRSRTLSGHPGVEMKHSQTSQASAIMNETHPQHHIPPTTVPPIYKLVTLSCFRTFYPKCACLVSTQVVKREKLQCDSRHSHSVTPTSPPRNLSQISHTVTSTTSLYS